MATISGGSMPLPQDEPARRLRAEAERLRDGATRQQNLAHRRAQFWAKADVALGFPAALLAGLSGSAALATADARVPAALAALAAAGFAAGATFLRSDRRRIANKRARQAWANVEAKASVKLARERLGPDDLAELFECRQVALAAYEGEDPQPSPLPVAPG